MLCRVRRKYEKTNEVVFGAIAIVRVTPPGIRRRYDGRTSEPSRKCRGIQRFKWTKNADRNRSFGVGGRGSAVATGGAKCAISKNSSDLFLTSRFDVVVDHVAQGLKRSGRRVIRGGKRDEVI